MGEASGQNGPRLKSEGSGEVHWQPWANPLASFRLAGSLFLGPAVHPAASLGNVPAARLKASPPMAVRAFWVRAWSFWAALLSSAAQKQAGPGA